MTLKDSIPVDLHGAKDSDDERMTGEELRDTFLAGCTVAFFENINTIEVGCDERPCGAPAHIRVRLDYWDEAETTDDLALDYAEDAVESAAKRGFGDANVYLDATTDEWKVCAHEPEPEVVHYEDAPVEGGITALECPDCGMDIELAEGYEK